MPSHCDLEYSSKKSTLIRFPLSSLVAGTPKERCVPEPSIACRRLRWKPGLSVHDKLPLSWRVEVIMCSRSRVKVARSFSLRAEGLNQASRSAAGKDEGIY